MTLRRALGFLALLAAGGAILWALFIVLPARYPAEPEQMSDPARTQTAETAERRITAHLFFIAEDGLQLVSIEQDVIYGEGEAEQASRILEAQLGPAPPPYLSPIPAGTMLRTVFVSDRGEAFVDLSPEVRSAHPGGSRNELFTVYAIVNALTANLPAITAVQIMINGQEVDSLAGHVDLRQPLRRNTRIVAESHARELTNDD